MHNDFSTSFNISGAGPPSPLFDRHITPELSGASSSYCFPSFGLPDSYFPQLLGGNNCNQHTDTSLSLQKQGWCQQQSQRSPIFPDIRDPSNISPSFCSLPCTPPGLSSLALLNGYASFHQPIEGESLSMTNSPDLSLSNSLCSKQNIISYRSNHTTLSPSLLTDYNSCDSAHSNTQNTSSSDIQKLESSNSEDFGYRHHDQPSHITSDNHLQCPNTSSLDTHSHNLSQIYDLNRDLQSVNEHYSQNINLQQLSNYSNNAYDEGLRNSHDNKHISLANQSSTYITDTVRQSSVSSNNYAQHQQQHSRRSSSSSHRRRHRRRDHLKLNHSQNKNDNQLLDHYICSSKETHRRRRGLLVPANASSSRLLNTTSEMLLPSPSNIGQLEYHPQSLPVYSSRMMYNANSSSNSFFYNQDTESSSSQSSYQQIPSCSSVHNINHIFPTDSLGLPPSQNNWLGHPQGIDPSLIGVNPNFQFQSNTRSLPLIPRYNQREGDITDCTRPVKRHRACSSSNSHHLTANSVVTLPIHNQKMSFSLSQENTQQQQQQQQLLPPISSTSTHIVSSISQSAPPRTCDLDCQQSYDLTLIKDKNDYSCPTTNVLQKTSDSSSLCHSESSQNLTVGLPIPCHSSIKTTTPSESLCYPTAQTSASSHNIDGTSTPSCYLSHSNEWPSLTNTISTDTSLHSSQQHQQMSQLNEKNLVTEEEERKKGEKQEEDDDDDDDDVVFEKCTVVLSNNTTRYPTITTPAQTITTTTTGGVDQTTNTTSCHHTESIPTLQPIPPTLPLLQQTPTTLNTISQQSQQTTPQCYPLPYTQRIQLGSSVSLTSLPPNVINIPNSCKPSHLLPSLCHTQQQQPQQVVCTEHLPFQVTETKAVVLSAPPSNIMSNSFSDSNIILTTDSSTSSLHSTTDTSIPSTLDQTIISTNYIEGSHVINHGTTTTHACQSLFSGQSITHPAFPIQSLSDRCLPTNADQQQTRHVPAVSRSHPPGTIATNDSSSSGSTHTLISSASSCMSTCLPYHHTSTPIQKTFSEPGCIFSVPTVHLSSSSIHPPSSPTVLSSSSPSLMHSNQSHRSISTSSAAVVLSTEPTLSNNHGLTRSIELQPPTIIESSLNNQTTLDISHATNHTSEILKHQSVESSSGSSLHHMNGESVIDVIQTNAMITKETLNNQDDIHQHINISSNSVSNNKESFLESHSNSVKDVSVQLTPSSEIISDTAIDGHVAVPLALGLIKIFNGIFSDEQRLKQRQLEVLLTRFLPVTGNTVSSESSVYVYGPLLKRMLGSALDVYAKSWAELSRTQSNMIKGLESRSLRCTETTTMLVRCTATFCAALDHFILDWLSQLEFQGDVFCIPPLKKTIYQKLLGNYFEPDILARRNHRVQTIGGLFRTLPSIILRQHPITHTTTTTTTTPSEVETIDPISLKDREEIDDDIMNKQFIHNKNENCLLKTETTSSSVTPLKTEEHLLDIVQVRLDPGAIICSNISSNNDLTTDKTVIKVHDTNSIRVHYKINCLEDLDPIHSFLKKEIKTTPSADVLPSLPIISTLTTKRTTIIKDPPPANLLVSLPNMLDNTILSTNAATDSSLPVVVANPEER